MKPSELQKLQASYESSNNLGDVVLRDLGLSHFNLLNYLLLQHLEAGTNCSDEDVSCIVALLAALQDNHAGQALVLMGR